MKIKAPIKFFDGRTSYYLAEKIAKRYGTELGETSVLEFSDGEFQPAYLESVRGCIVFVIQSTFPPQDNLMELLMMIILFMIAGMENVTLEKKLKLMFIHTKQIQSLIHL